MGEQCPIARRWIAAFIIVMVAASGAPAAQSPMPTLDELLNRAGSYMIEAVIKLSNVVCEEAYLQEVKGWPPVKRRLSSELLLVGHPVETQSWMVFRDTTAVDGKPVAGRSERLTQLFVKPTSDSWARARAIDADSDRYHLVRPPVVAIANPMLGPMALQFRYQPKLKFVLRGQDPEVGPGVAIVDFEEPYLRASGVRVREPMLGPLGGNGRAWIETGTGRIVKTDVRIAVDRGRNTTTYIRDTRLGIDRPSEMRTTWSGPSRNTLTGVATYGQCRRFGVETTETILPLQ